MLSTVEIIGSVFYAKYHAKKKKIRHNHQKLRLAVVLLKTPKIKKLGNLLKILAARE